MAIEAETYNQEGKSITLLAKNTSNEGTALKINAKYIGIDVESDNISAKFKGDVIINGNLFFENSNLTPILSSQNIILYVGKAFMKKRTVRINFPDNFVKSIDKSIPCLIFLTPLYKSASLFIKNQDFYGFTVSTSNDKYSEIEFNFLVIGFHQKSQ